MSCRRFKKFMLNEHKPNNGLLPFLLGLYKPVGEYVSSPGFEYTIAHSIFLAMRFTALTAMLALVTHTSCIAAYSITAYQESGCNTNDPNRGSINVVGASPSLAENKACFQLPFQGLSISASGCLTTGTITPFTDINCITPANVAIPGPGILCLDSTTAFQSFAITKC